jgi:hypothetical protein
LTTEPARKQIDWTLWIGLTPFILLILWKLVDFAALRIPSLNGFTIYPLMIFFNHPLSILIGMGITIWGLSTYVWRAKEPDWIARILFGAIVLFGCSLAISFISSMESKQSLITNGNVYYLTRSPPINARFLEYHFAIYKCDIFGVFYTRQHNYICQYHICDFDSDVELTLDVDVLRLLVDGTERFSTQV